MPVHFSKERFGELVEKALSELPEPFAEIMEEVPVEVRSRPTRKELRQAGLEEDHLLMGLYQGTPLTLRSVEQSGQAAGVIYIFQDDLEEVCDSESALVREVRITVLHEIGHHFGLDEDELDRLGYG